MSKLAVIVASGVEGNRYESMPYSFADFMDSDRLPTLPHVAVRVIELVQSDEPDVREISRVIRSDAAIASRILRTGNSALLGMRRSLTSVEEAVPQLGFTLVRTLVLGCTLSGIRTIPDNAEHAIRAHWRSSLTQAVFAENLALETPGADPPTYFLAGLLQDIGVLAALCIDPENYLAHVWSESRFPDVTDAEFAYYGFDHTDVGLRLCSLWGLPESFCDAVFTHHNSVDLPDGASMLSALHAANLCSAFVARNGREGTMDRLAGFLTHHYGWSLEKIEAIVCEAMIQVHESAALFSYDIGELSGTRTIENARRLLANLALVD